MYGLLLESVQHYVKEKHGEAVWQRVLEDAGLHNMVFTTHRQYDDRLMVRLAEACSHVLPQELPSVDHSMHYFGTFFVEFCRHYSYDKVLRVSGRHFRDFLHGIDNLHETIRFSYPKMHSPSFMVEEEDRHGCVLVYKSTRRGFAHYVMGQLHQCALQMFDVSVQISVLERRDTECGCHVRYRLQFNNAAYCPAPTPGTGRSPTHTGMETVPGSLLFQIFPFCVVFDKDLIIQRVGSKAPSLLGDKCAAGRSLTSVFTLRRPVVQFTWDNIVCQQNVVFELEAKADGNPQEEQTQHTALPSALASGCTSSLSESTGYATGAAQPCLPGADVTSFSLAQAFPLDHTHAQSPYLRDVTSHDQGDKVVPSHFTSFRAQCPLTVSRRTQRKGSGKKVCKKLLRGQMKLVSEWGHVVFFCTPLFSDLDQLIELNMYLTDLNMYDNSRDLVLQGHNHAPLLESMMEQQQAVSKKIRENLKALDEQRKRGEEMVYSMLPKTIADRLKQGQSEDPMSTCQTFDAVTILFSHLVGFKDICSECSAMHVVQVIDRSFAVFDPIVDKYGLFKVETLGDAVYMVAGGVPDHQQDHAQRVAGMALDFISQAHHVKNPVDSESLTVRIGIHTGSIVAGVVGKKTPQYCLFGDTVNTAARIQSHSLPGRIHLSEPCHQCLKDTDFVSIYRGQINVKGKGQLKTYWLAGRKGRPCTQSNSQLYHREREQHQVVRQIGSVDGDLHALHASSSGSVLSTVSQSASGDAANGLPDVTADTADVFIDNVSDMRQRGKNSNSRPTGRETGSAVTADLIEKKQELE